MGQQGHGESEATHQILRGLAVALLLSGAVLALETVGALLSRSLSVTIDAVHNLPDLFAFAVSYLSLAGTATGTTEEHTFGSHRLEVFAAILNAFVILAAGVVFAYPALTSLLNHASAFGTVDPEWIFLAAVPTLGLRAVAGVYLGRIPRAARDLNVRSVLLHLATDVAITVALIVDAAVLFLHPESAWVDSAAALVIAGILVYESIPIFRGGWEVLTERVPRGVSLPALTTSIRSVERVREVHDLHVWAVCPTLVCMTAHVSVEEMPVSESSRITATLREMVEREFGIVHSVFEVETEPPAAHPSGSG